MIDRALSRISRRIWSAGGLSQAGEGAVPLPQDRPAHRGSSQQGPSPYGQAQKRRFKKAPGSKQQFPAHKQPPENFPMVLAGFRPFFMFIGTFEEISRHTLHCSTCLRGASCGHNRCGRRRLALRAARSVLPITANGILDQLSPAPPGFPFCPVSSTGAPSRRPQQHR